MVVPALKTISLTAVLFLVLLVSSGSSCFGPKLFIGVTPGVEGEMRYHLVAIYLHEKTGIESNRVELKPDHTAAQAIVAKEIDLGFSVEDSLAAPVVLRLDNEFKLFSGERPLSDLQFTTVSRALKRLQKRLDAGNLNAVRQAIAQGTLPATAIRDFMLEEGWI